MSDEQAGGTDDVVVRLPRGGCIVRTSAGLVQVGAPPETIKDCMVLKISNPTIYIIPTELFDRDNGVNLAEVEFPAYYNFFVLKRRVQFVCTPEVEVRLRQVFRETLLGPEEIDLSSEFPGDAQQYAPDLARECASLRTFHAIDELFTFTLFDADTMTAAINEHVQVKKEAENFVITDDGRLIATVPSHITLPASMYEKETLSSVRFEPPSFGVTTLGSSHGFDPTHNTCGIVLWLNGRGIMVDPPLRSSNQLKRAGIPPHLIDSIILTHCHADHDAGLFHKVLEEGQVTIYTTQTIMQSFVRKYAAIANTSVSELMTLFNFRSVPLTGPLRLFGGELHFHYSVHTIPCVGFSAYFGGKSLFYSGDTRNEPEFLRRLQEEGVMKKKRAEFFLQYGWHQTAILHEAGVPPIHTPMSVLAGLPDDVKDRLYLIHTTTSSVPEGSGLKVAEEGVEHSIILDPIQPPSFGDAIELLSIIEQIDLFENFSLTQAKEILQSLRKDKWSPGQPIIAQGAIGNHFFVIASGVVSVLKDSVELKKLSIGDYFGEMALITDAPRSASCIAVTDVTTLTFDRLDFLRILRGETEVVDRIFRLARMRLTPSWTTLCSNSFLNRLSNNQKRSIESCLDLRQLADGEIVWKCGDPVNFAVLISSGTLVNVDNNQEYGSGALIGCRTSTGSSFSVTMKVAVRSFTLQCKGEAWVYFIEREALNKIYKVNPGMRLSLMHRDVIL